MTTHRMLSFLECGCIAGVLWSFSQMIMIVSASEAGLILSTDMQLMSGEWYFALDILTGVWVIGIYLLARAYFQSIPNAAIGTVVAWWVIQSLISIKSGGFDYTVVQTLVFSLAPFICMSLSLLSGIWLYEKLNSKRGLFGVVEA